MTYLVAAFRSPQVPSQSLSFPHGKDTLGHMDGGPVRGSVRVSAGSRIAERTVPVLYCRQSRSSAQAIIAPAPDAADMLAGQTTEYNGSDARTWLRTPLGRPSLRGCPRTS
jgi:hypothetical protein